ncbi:phosphotransferase enzyme family protein [Deinococcus peraridilitoris]|uniref:Putative homoserine kinase type II (Protein kinase fold) n=1 Tax=Deinococcus peraridilitoris (strain DSM 19664 / LMG 22246 / CIP 109416 / KR-200) TaxID=937777 RepID=K9ZWK5_DEIPD|nr:phosphotransferase [Deinococcus peraridilitoris]AFZ66028.1 putative homoserine kinase type II (protein kinase fold) [Deinococcus peraridilitoris DSM 19664]
MVDLSRPLLHDFARLFGVTRSSLHLVNSGINVVWRGEREGTTVYLRCGHEAHFGEAKVRGATSYLAHVFSRGAPVCEPFRSVNGEWFESRPSDQGRWYATLVREAPGRRLHPGQLDPAEVTAWGRAIGALHCASRDFAPPPDALIKRFSGMWTSEIEEALARSEPRLLPLYAELSAWAQSAPQEPFGVTHGDMRAGNAFWDGAQITIIDFDEPNWDRLAADLARPLLECSAGRCAALLPFLLAGYQEVCGVQGNVEQALPNLLRQRALIMFAWSAQEWHGPWTEPPAEVAEVDSSDTRAFQGWLLARLLSGDLARTPGADAMR